MTEPHNELIETITRHFDNDEIPFEDTLHDLVLCIYTAVSCPDCFCDVLISRLAPEGMIGHCLSILHDSSCPSHQDCDCCEHHDEE